MYNKLVEEKWKGKKQKYHSYEKIAAAGADAKINLSMCERQQRLCVCAIVRAHIFFWSEILRLCAFYSRSLVIQQSFLYLQI